MSAAADPIPSEAIRPLKRAEYLKLAETGAFDGERVELLYGRIVTLSPQRERHSYSVTQLTHLLIRAVGDRARIRIQMPFLAPHESVPEPDVAVVPPGDYLNAHPAVAYLVIEVADSSLRVDRAKAALYAEAGVPEYWIVNLVAGFLERHQEPGPEGYGRVTQHGRGQELTMSRFADVVVRVAEVLPAA
ncbi:MAG: Uma2 family endonuclease [Polyangiaceae bacterium]